MDKWQEQRMVQTNVFYEENGEQLVMKVPMAIPYLAGWDESEEADGLIIFKGDFFRTTQRKFANDTLYTYCTKENASRENVFSLLQQVKKHVSDEPTSPGKKALNFFKNLTKDYTQFNSSTIAYFWIEDLPLKIYTYQEFIPATTKLVHSPPPDLV
ncbi:hypothetical protein [Emticicia agri]|uniref:Uncharacterized protein n=1 Tax=Emticicia agri TaxID=2492393 RepID=A0A4Q5M0G0_9BACT|nr:hypothetical protein [Emticicia agri]RYU95485.1 hypothetical protein EWM59_11345 [Emticicia agri]